MFIIASIITIYIAMNLTINITTIIAMLLLTGEHESAIKEFTSVLSSGPNDTWHHVWFRREMAYYYLYRQNDSFRTYNYDEDLSNRTKHGMSQHESFIVPSEKEYKSYKIYVQEKKEKENENKKNENDENEKIKKIEKDRAYAEQLSKIEFFVKATSRVAQLIQLDHPGFMPNQRQYRQFGLSVLQIAQSLREHISLLYENKVCVSVCVLMRACVYFLPRVNVNETNKF
jgi:hypothetical protein